MEIQRDEYLISDDKARLNVDAVTKLLNGTYWASDRSREAVAKSIEHSVCLGLYRGEAQIGFARAITDYVTYTYFCDVIIAPGERGSGLGKWLVETLINHPALQTTNQALRTKDAQALYERFGFERTEYLRRSDNDWSKMSAP